LNLAQSELRRGHGPESRESDEQHRRRRLAQLAAGSNATNAERELVGGDK
jgi:hypothetical protein